MSTHGEPMQDRLAEEDPGLIAIYRVESAEVPSPDVDAALMAAARRAVGAKPQSLACFRSGPWRAPLAAAATVVLSATVVYWMVHDRGVEQLSSPVVTEYFDAVTPPPLPPVSPMPVPQAGAPQSSTKAQVAGAENRASRSMTSGRKELENLPAHVAPSRQVVTASADTEPSTKTVGPDANSAADKLSAPKTTLPSTMNSSAGVGIIAQEAPRGLSESGERAARAEDSSAGKATLKEEGPALKSASPAAPSVAARGRYRAEPQVPHEAESVARIRQLMRDGRRAEALEELSALRRFYPTYVLPEDLAELAKELPQDTR